MKINLSTLLLVAAILTVAVGCSSEQAKPTPEQEKSFAGGPPPANYMDKAKEATKSGQAATNTPAAPTGK